MGVGRLICNLFLGPFLIYCLLMTHVIYHSFIKEPAVKGGNVQAPSWPSSVSAQEKADLIAQRKQIVKDYKDLVTGKGNAKQIADRSLSKDCQFEDPFQRFNNAKDMVDAFTGELKGFHSAELKILEEHHGPHEIVLPMKLSVSPFEGWKSPEAYVVVHLLLEQPSKKGEPEKIFKFYDEYQGNPLLNERTVAPSILGKIHSKLRVFQGQLALLIIRTFGLA